MASEKNNSTWGGNHVSGNAVVGVQAQTVTVGGISLSGRSLEVTDVVVTEDDDQDQED